MAKLTRIGIDTSKSVFQLHGVDETEQVALRKQLRRREFLAFLAKLDPTMVGLEACGASHHWGRELAKLGHRAVLMPPQHVKPYVGRNKNDKIDAAAICEAMSRPKVAWSRCRPLGPSLPAWRRPRSSIHTASNPPVSAPPGSA